MRKTAFDRTGDYISDRPGKYIMTLIKSILGTIGLLTLITIAIFDPDDYPKESAPGHYTACEGLTKQHLIVCQNNERRHQEVLQSNEELKSKINLIPTY